MFVRPALLMVACAYQVLAYHSGAPESACHNMTPHHPISLSMPEDGEAVAQGGSNPYKLTVNAMTYSEHGEVEVTLTGPEFEGFMLMAQKVDGSPVGHIELIAGTQHIKCSGNAEATVTHTEAFEDGHHESEEEHVGHDPNAANMTESAEALHPNGTEPDSHENSHEDDSHSSEPILDGPTKTIHLHWEDVERTKESVKFVATVVQDRTVFWVGLTSDTVKYASAASDASDASGSSGSSDAALAMPSLPLALAALSTLFL